MKRLLSFVISVSLLLSTATVMPAMAAANLFVSGFDGTGLEQGWRIDGTTSGVTVTHNAADGVVDFSSTQTTASEYTYYNTTSLRNTSGFSVSSSGNIIIAYDFKINSYGTVDSSGRLFDVCPEIYIGGVRQGFKEKHIPYVTHDGKLVGTNFTAEIGKWYTSVCTINTSTKVATAKWYERGGSDVLIESSLTGPGYAANAEIRGIYVTPLTNGSFSFDNFSISTKSNLAVSSPVEGGTVQTRTGLNIEGTIPYDVTAATVMLNGTVVASVDNSANADTFSLFVDISGYSGGDYVLQVEGGGFSHSVNLIFQEPVKYPLEITSPADGETVQTEETLSIGGTIPYDLTEADITIDGTKIASVTNTEASDTFSASLDITKYKEGNHVVGIIGGNDSDSITLYFQEPPKEYGFKSLSDGAMVDRDVFSSVQLLAPAGKEITVLLDGETVYEYVADEEIKTVDFSDKLSIGDHVLEAVWAGEKKTVSFSAIAKSVTKNLNVTFDNGKYDPLTFNKLIIGQDENGDDVIAKEQFFEGVDGQKNGAFGFVTDRAWTSSALYNRSGPHLRQNTQSYGWKDGMVRISYDVKMFAKAYAELEIKSSGKWGYIGEPIFSEAGLISKSSDPYPLNEWIHVEHVINIDNKTEDLIVNGKTYLSSSPITYDIADITQVTFYYCPRNTKDAGLGFAIDNYVMQHEKPFYGFGEMMYSVDGGELTAAEDNRVAAGTDALTLKTASSLLAVGDLTDKVSITADGYTVAVSGAAMAKDGTLSVQLDSALPEGSKALLLVRDDNGAALYRNEFRVSDSGIAMNTAALSSGGTPLYLAKQLLGLSGCTAEVSLKNNASVTQSGMLIGCVYSGSKLVSINAKSVTLPAGTETIESIDLALTENAQKLHVRLFVIDSLANRNALSGVWSLR